MFFGGQSTSSGPRSKTESEGLPLQTGALRTQGIKINHVILLGSPRTLTRLTWLASLLQFVLRTFSGCHRRRSAKGIRAITFWSFLNSWRCGNHPHPHKMRKLRPKLRPRRIWTVRIQKYCKAVEKRKLRPWSEFPPRQNSDHGPSFLPGKTQTMVRVSSPAKLRPWSELSAKMVMGVVPVGVATPAEPRGEKKLFFCATFGRWKTFKIC